MLMYNVTKQVLRNKRYLLYFFLLWFVTVTVFIWLININLLAYVLNSPDLTTTVKIGFISSSYVNYFKYLNNPVALSSVIFSVLVAVNFTLLIFLWKEGKQRSNLARSNAGAFAAMIGSHCISCGTSLVAPLITAFAGSGAFLSAERATTSIVIATGANILGIIIILWSIKGVVKRIRSTGLLYRQVE